MKENIRMIKDSDEIDLLSENNNNITNNWNTHKMFRISAELGCKIIRISPDAKDLAKETTKKSFIKSLSERLSNLKFNADHSIRFRAL